MATFSCMGLAQTSPQIPDAAAYIQQAFDKGFAELTDPSLSLSDRRQRFHQAILNLVDVRSTAYYTLGSSAGQTSPGDMEAFVSAFRDYTVASYEDELGAASRPSLKVTGLQPCEAGDVLVTAELARLNDGASSVTFRIRKLAKRPVIVDVRVSGIWMSVIKRAEFAAFLYLNGGSVAKLAAHLSKTADTIRSRSQ